MQGGIVGILDANDNAVVKYTIWCRSFDAMLQKRSPNNKKDYMVLDTLCAIAGSVIACVYNEIGYFTLLLCVTAIPLYVNNYKVLMKAIQSKDD